MADVTLITNEVFMLLLIALLVILITRPLAIPYTLGLVVVGLFISMGGLTPTVRLTPELVLVVFLPALLFEGSWSLSLPLLRKNWQPIFLLAVPGLLLALVLIAVPLHFLAPFSWAEAFLLAAILSPTDPIAVLGLFRQLQVNKHLSTIIEGESLFNDGVAGALYQVFLTLVLISLQGQHLTIVESLLQGLGILVLQSGGGIVIGLVSGYLISYFVELVDDPLIETTITLATAYGVYLLANTLHTSGILAVIVTALMLGNYGKRSRTSERTGEVVHNFWTIAAFLVNALLFLLMGMQLTPLTDLFSTEAPHLLLIAGLTILAVLTSRLFMVILLPRRLSVDSVPSRSWHFVIFWSGLRGALSLALVLALPLNVPERNTLIFSTYAVVFFTLLVQGFSLRSVLKHLPFVSS